jgi:predicted ribonuclease YlaK
LKLLSVRFAEAAAGRHACEATSFRTIEAIHRPPPAPVTSLLGRDAELAAVTALLQDSTRVVTITGPGGTGKTRLAIAVADRLREWFAGGVAYLES